MKCLECGDVLFKFGVPLRVAEDDAPYKEVPSRTGPGASAG